jgi:hypothetical protein
MLRRFLCVITICLVAEAARADDKQPRAIAGWGSVVDPDADCTIKAENGKLTVTVPSTHHNLNPALASNAPRVLQEVVGNFTATVKVTGEFKPGEKATKPRGYPFNGAGLLIWNDAKNCVRLERNIWWIPEEGLHACYPPLLEYYRDGEYLNTNPPGTTDEFFKGRSTYLRLERKGDKVAASYSHDGKEWTAVKEISVELPQKVQVGVAAVNSSDKTFTVEFEDFTVDTAK